MTESIISCAAQESLLIHARHTLAHGSKNTRLSNIAPQVKKELSQNGGGFVTLSRKDGQLRGCIGVIDPIYDLITLVSKMTESAAYQDPRFPRVTESEKGDLRIEISLLAKPTILPSLEDLVIGRDGLIVEKGSNRGLLLPQVASERNWDSEHFFYQTLLKAGLSPQQESFSSVTTLFFSAYHFSEKDYGLA